MVVPVIEKPSNAHGCWNTPRKDGYMVRVGRTYDLRSVRQKRYLERQLLAFYEDKSTKECQHKINNPDDPRCAGCTK